MPDTYILAVTYIYSERGGWRGGGRERKYNEVQACFVLESFYFEFSPLRALSMPARSA